MARENPTAVFPNPQNQHEALINFVAACHDAQDMNGVRLGAEAIRKYLAQQQQ